MFPFNSHLSYLISCFLCLASCVLCLVYPAALAQSSEAGDWIIDPQEPVSGNYSEYRESPDVQSYAEMCKAMYWKNLRNYQEARKHLVEAIKLDPHSSFLYAELAETLIGLKEYREAFRASQISAELNPDNPTAHYWLGVLNIARQDRQNAIQELKKATELKPDYIEAQYRLAPLLFEDEDYEGAAKAYGEMVKLRPYDPELRLRLGISYSRAGQLQEAVRELNIVTKLRSDDIESHFHLAYLYAQQSKNKEAIEECLIVLRVDPGNPDMNLLLGELYVTAGQFDEAISSLEKVLNHKNSKKADIAEAHYRLATAYKGKGDGDLASSSYQNSIAIYKSILEENQNNAGVHYDIAMVYESMGEFTLAEQHLRKHIELIPDEPNAYNFLGYMFAERGVNLEEAVTLIKEALEKEPQNGAFHDSLGWAYFSLGNLDEAIAELEKAAQLIPDDSEIRIHLGEVYLRKGGEFVKKAILEWEKALEIKPNESLQQRLEALRKSSG